MAKITEETLRLNIVVNGDQTRKQMLDISDAMKDQEAEVKRLKSELSSLSKTKKKESDDYKKTEKSLRDAEKALTDSRKKYEELSNTIPLASKTLSELRNEENRLRALLNKSIPGTANYRMLADEIKKVHGRVKELSISSKNANSCICGLSQATTNFVVGIKSVIDSLGWVKNLIKESVAAFREQDEAMADAMKTTNLTKEEIRALSDELKKIDTRTAQNDLLGLVRIGGKLGVQGSENLLAFARAADKINVALKDDLGGDTEGAIATVGKLVDIFQLEGQFGLEDSLLKVGSAINDLGMASTANEGYIVDFTSRLAGIAPNADISITKILGLGATLDKYGQQAETAGTAIGQTIMAMFKRTETFANIAKMPLQEFADLLNKDVNEALLRVLEGMNDGGGLASVVSAMEEMHLNGQRASTILGTLSKNTAKLRVQQELAASAFEKGSSLQDEFNTKNESATAIAEKHKKAIQEQVVSIGEKLLPVANGALKLAETGLSVISDIIPIMMKFKGAILAVAGAYTALVAAKKINDAIDRARNFNFKQWKTDAAIEATLLQGATKSTIALSVAKNLLAGNFKAAGTAAKMFGASLKSAMGPIGWAVMAIEGLLALFSPLIKRLNDQHKLNKELAESNNKLSDSYSSVALEINKEKSRLDSMKDAVDKSKKGSKERAEAIKKINEEYKTYLPSLLTEKSSNEDVAIALAEVNKQLENKIKLQAKEKALGEVNERVDSQTTKAMTDFDTLLEKSTGNKTTAAMRERMNKAVMEYRNILENAISDAEKDKARKRLAYTYFDLGGNQLWLRGTKLNGIINDLETVIDYGAKAKERLDQLYGNPSAPTMSGRIKISNTGGDEPTPASSQSGDDSKSKLKELERLVEESKKIIADGNKDAVNAENKRYDEELKRFNAQKNALTKAGIDYNALMVTLEETHKTNLSKIDIKGFEDKRKAIEANRKLERAQTENRHAEELSAAISLGQDVTELKKIQAKELSDIDMKYALELQDLLNEIQNIDGTINLNIEGLTESELTSLKIKLEEIRELRNELSGTSGTTNTASDGEEKNANPENKKNGTMLGLNADEWSALFDGGTEGWQKMELAARAFGETANQAMSIVSMAMDRQRKIEQQSLKEYSKANDKKKAALEARLSSGLITEEQYNSAVQQMDAEYQAYEEELALKQAKREKALSLTQAIINTAMGITMALATMPSPLNFINAGIVAAMGAAEIALIASTPVTTGAEEGGSIFTEREQDGKTFNAKLSPKKRGLISGPTVLVGENGSEYVIPHDGLENPTLMPIIENIEAARKNGRLDSLDFRAVYSPTTVSSGFAVGGTISKPGIDGNINEPTNSEGVNNGNESLIKKLDEVISLLKEPTPAIVSMLGPSGLVEANKKYLKLKNKGNL